MEQIPDDGVVYEGDVEPPPARLVAPTVEPRSWGLGLRASAIDRRDGGALGEGVGALLRFRPGAQLELEVEVGRDSWDAADRNDTRGGAALLARLFDADFSPYVLAGGGGAAVREGAAHRVDGYLTAGAGLSLRIGDQVLLGGDVRWIWSQRLDGDADPGAPAASALKPMAPAAAPVPMEVRISTLIYF